MTSPRPLSAKERELVARVETLVARERTTTVDLLLSLNEMEDGGLHTKLGFSSLWAYCIGGLHWSNGTTGRNFAAAKLLRRFPIAAQYLRDGRLNCSTFLGLKDVLTLDNHVELFNRASHLTEEKVAELVVTIAPKPIPPETLRKLPTRSRPSPVFESTATTAPSDRAAPTSTAPNTPAESTTTSFLGATSLALDFDQSVPLEPFHPDATLEPLQKDVWLLKLPIDRAIRSDLEEVQSLLSHALPGASLGDILVECIRRTRIVAERQKYGVRAPAKKRARLTPILGVTDDSSTRTPISGVTSDTSADGPVSGKASDTAGDRSISAENADASVVAPISGVTDDASARSVSVATDDASTQTPISRVRTTVATSAAPSASGIASTDASLSDLRSVAETIASASEAIPDGSRFTPISGVTSPATQARNRQRAGDRPPRNPSRAVKRAVAERDGRCCQYVGANGQKCGSKYQLEFDHWRAYALGGEPTVENVRILCKAHNQLCAVELFGEEFMSRFVRRQRICKGQDSQMAE